MAGSVVVSWRRHLVLAALLITAVTGFFAAFYTVVPGRVPDTFMPLLRVLVVPPLATAAACTVPLLYNGASDLMFKKPLAAIVVFFGSLSAAGAVNIGFLFEAFFNSGDLGRAAIRIFVLPLLSEAVYAAGRFVLAAWGAPGMPASYLTILLCSMMFYSALVGRIFMSSMSSIGATVALSVFVAAVEVIMRFTVRTRDELYHRWGRACRRTCCRQQGRQPTQDPRTSRRRALIAYYHFLSMDTLAEDVAILLVLPLSALLRLPLRPGDPPPSLHETATRVAIQWTLELTTDAFPFVMYALLKRMLPASVAYPATGAGSILAMRQESAIHLRKADPAPVVSPLGDKDLLDDTSVRADNPLQPECLGDSPAAPTDSHVAEHEIPRPQLHGTESDTQGSDTKQTSCATALLPQSSAPCVAGARERIAAQHASDGRLEHLAVWHHISPEDIRAAQQLRPSSWDAISLPTKAMWWLTVQADFMSLRISAAWHARYAHWTGLTCAHALAMVTFILRELFSTASHCVYSDAAGRQYVDQCGMTPK